MTFTEIQTAVAERLNLTSAEALARIGRYINDRYRRVTSSVGLNTARRGTNAQPTISGTPRVTFALEKIETVYCAVAGRTRILNEINYDEWRQMNTLSPQSGDAEYYAVENAGAATVVTVLYPTPNSIYSLSADGVAPATTTALSAAVVPAFPADFHDALIFGAMADEYSKLEKPKQSMQYEQMYEGRVSELRYFIAKSIYLSQHQGQRSTGSLMCPPSDWNQ